MFILASLLGLTLSSNLPVRSDITIQIIDETEVIPSAHVFVNDSVVGISDSSGRVTLHNIICGDRIAVTHLGHETETFSINALNDTTIFLLPKKFMIQEAQYSKDFDYDILKSKLKPGLSGGVHPGKIPVISRDTLIFKENRYYINEKGNLSYLLKYYVPILYGYQIDIIGKDVLNGDGISEEKLDRLKLKPHFENVFSNVQFFTECVCKCKNYKGFRVEYRGINDYFDVFYFFIPPQDLRTYKCRGFIYIDSSSGILDHIEATCTSINESYLSYDLSVYYQYFVTSNTVLPKNIAHIAYFNDEDGSIYQTHRKRISLDWEHTSK